jgi:hypothetical protein
MSENSSEYFGSMSRTPFLTKIGLSETVAAGLELRLSLYSILNTFAGPVYP